MNQKTYLKVPFVWEEPKPLIDVPSRLKFKPVSAVGDDILISSVASVMASSLDANHQKKILERDPQQAADMFLKSAREGYSYKDEWWQFGVNEEGEIVGFVLPVIFKGCTKDGLEEGTIYDIGVLPKYRGLGYGNDLLSQGTRVLQELGVWRVFCDTAVNNVPMISIFRRVGYRQYSESWNVPFKCYVVCG
ncbi:MAG: GNAT family N-acetyltransferase [Chroococcidiopsidaceae cyanobacterium CP_BM_ER_R8_30]|nr:GNAT family N-acetyltransferase [Chroococcidiopsidaceae cyanobacterium CP_BM_ER_R8_30]